MIAFDKHRATDTGEATLISIPDDAMQLSASRTAHQEVVISQKILSPGNRTLSDLVGSRRSLFVVTPTVDRLYGKALRDYIASGHMHTDSEVFVLKVDESSKNLDAVSAVCIKANDFGLERTAPIVAIGGGVCLDISGLAAALYRRGVPNIKVPTTLIGLIDAGIGTKNAVNHHGHKSLLGTFSPPVASILDSNFLRTLPARHLRNGFAEMLKMSVVAEHELFDLLYAQGPGLLRSNFQDDYVVASEAIRRSVFSMLRELSANLYERGEYRRKVDFGHTFSPYIETASKHAVLHGEAVAIDIALSTQISCKLGILTVEERDAVLTTIDRTGLPLHWSGIDVEDMYSSLKSIRLHRDGNLHLVVPDKIGSCVFLEDGDIDASLLNACVDELASKLVS
ncbi:sedoheptulose 7-phosphate cyclase [Nocardia asiatica]|uniref:sedoheptulose 7-phosphate cyclase n=1 Tax=Nocardia asiatica TaxID=209252 RepID=UPI003EDEED91